MKMERLIRDFKSIVPKMERLIRDFKSIVPKMERLLVENGKTSKIERLLVERLVVESLVIPLWGGYNE